MKIDITLRDLTAAEAVAVTGHAQRLEGGAPSVEAAPSVAKSSANGVSKPTVDAKKVAAHAQANPAKKKAAAKEEAEEEDDEDLLPAPRSKKASAAANGAAKRKAAPPPADEEEDEEEESEDEEEEAEDDEIPEEIMEAKKLRDVLRELQAQGIKDQDDLKAECKRIQARVPVLSRIGNLEDRITRTLEVMELGDATS